MIKKDDTIRIIETHVPSKICDIYDIMGNTLDQISENNLRHEMFNETMSISELRSILYDELNKL